MNFRTKCAALLFILLLMCWAASSVWFGFGRVERGVRGKTTVCCNLFHVMRIMDFAILASALETSLPYIVHTILLGITYLHTVHGRRQQSIVRKCLMVVGTSVTCRAKKWDRWRKSARWKFGTGTWNWGNDSAFVFLMAYHTACWSPRARGRLLVIGFWWKH